jgi:hypothetical protein
MNGGGEYIVGSCFEHYTGYHGQRSQQWGYETTQVLSSDTSNVPSDGLYLYDTGKDVLSGTNPESRFSVPLETGVPVITIVSIVHRETTIFSRPFSYDTCTLRSERLEAILKHAKFIHQAA